MLSQQAIPVRGSRIWSGLQAGLMGVTLALAPLLGMAASTPSPDPDPIVEAREALRKKDKSRLAALRTKVNAARHPLALWVEYWDLSNRLGEARADEVEAFYERWRGSYVEDRLRNDWLLELGRRRDFPALTRDFALFRMNDDREVSCYALLAEHLAGRDVREAARLAWFAQRDIDDGCMLMASTLFEARRLGPDDIWRKARSAIENNRPAAAKAAAGLLGSPVAREIQELLDNPLHWLRKPGGSAHRMELNLLALMRVAANDTDVAAGLLEDRWQHSLGPERAAWAWAYAGRQAAFRLQPEATDYYRRAWSLLKKDVTTPGWTDETVAWSARAALRAAPGQDRWALLLRTMEAMAPSEQRDPAWAYWRARALLATAAKAEAGDAQRDEARRQLAAMASPWHFYGQHAAEDLGLKLVLPAAPAPLTSAEKDAAAANPGLARALSLTFLGLRDEARREWNFTLRGMNDRELQASARLACDASDWQLCINTGERTRAEVDVTLRYPMPFATEISRAALAAGLEPALVFGLIRQETRFMTALRSSAGASGLMQLMPATARWVARKLGLEFKPEQINDPELNLRLGTQYLKLVLDDLGGSLPMAAAAYNAGPGRPRRWREGAVLEPAAWAENIPFHETRDYVKKVMSNASIYAALLDSQPPQLKARLGRPIGPRDQAAPAANTELP